VPNSDGSRHQLQQDYYSAVLCVFYVLNCDLSAVGKLLQVQQQVSCDRKRCRVRDLQTKIRSTGAGCSDSVNVDMCFYDSAELRTDSVCACGWPLYGLQELVALLWPGGEPSVEEVSRRVEELQRLH
jgi:hypothetical protein